MVNANIWQPTQTVDPIQAQIDALYAQLQGEPTFTFAGFLQDRGIDPNTLTSAGRDYWEKQYDTYLSLAGAAQLTRFETDQIREQIAALKKQLAEQQQIEAYKEYAQGGLADVAAYKKAMAAWQTTADAYTKKLGYVPETFIAQTPKPQDWGVVVDRFGRVVGQREYAAGGIAGDPYTQMMGRGVPQAMPTYEAPFYGMMAGLDRPKPYLKWFESMFPKLMQRFMATQEIPYTTSAWGAQRAEAQQRAAWAEWLPTQRESLFEEWHGLGEAGRGERPWSYAPRIRTF